MTAKPPIEFHFDFISPYGYLAAAKIDALAERMLAEGRLQASTGPQPC